MDHIGAFVKLVRLFPEFLLQLVQQKSFPGARDPVDTHDNGFVVGDRFEQSWVNIDAGMQMSAHSEIIWRTTYTSVVLCSCSVGDSASEFIVKGAPVADSGESDQYDREMTAAKIRHTEELRITV